MATAVLHYHDGLNILICKTHGFALQPKVTAIERHLRGHDHKFDRSTLKATLQWVRQLLLAPTRQLLAVQRSCRCLRPPIAHLSILEGFMCACCIEPYLTTSADLIRRHVSNAHRGRTNAAAAGIPCILQTIFSETKHRHYFRVTSETAKFSAPCEHFESQYVGKHGRYALMAGSIKVLHPYAVQAKQHIPWLSEDMLDTLFKSPALRLASRPLFDSTHVDSRANMTITFRLQESDPAFYTALVYSMVALTQGDSQLSLHLQRSSLKFLHQRIMTMNDTSQLPAIGTILLLKTTAYKLRDQQAHEAHEQGLSAVISNTGLDVLTPAARRGYFWQDLLAAVLMGSSRLTSLRVLPEFSNPAPLPILDYGAETVASRLPPGFIRHGQDLPPGLFDCILAVQELQDSCGRLAGSAYSVRYEALDHIQAYTESLLVDYRDVCMTRGPIARMVWLAIFICSYCSWTEVWNDVSFPSKLSEDLLACIYQTCENSTFLQVWNDRVDLMIWLLMVASSIADLDENRSVALRQQRTRLLPLVRNALQNHTTPSIRTAFNQARTQFLYYASWRCDLGEDFASGSKIYTSIDLNYSTINDGDL